MRNMQIARTTILGKNTTLSAVARSASCSRGWLRLVVQTIFAVISVASFILIVIMSIRSNANLPVAKPPPPPPRCLVNNCRVVCRETPHFEKYESDIFDAVSVASTNCHRVALALNGPSFVNSTLPVNWLSHMRAHIREITINRGNLMHIPPEAFMSHFSRHIRILEFKSITIKTFGEDSLVGLSNLQELNIKHCKIIEIQANALRAVDDSLRTLTITGSDYGNPVNVTGMTRFEKLETVDFSSNDFNDVLGYNSFTGLENCKVLYLNSCKITAIGEGTFDHLLNIDVIYLNNNFLVTVPPGLFDVMMTVNPRPRIDLQNNTWHCDCSSKHLQYLVANGLLLVEPRCYTPVEAQGKTFSEFITYCNFTSNLNPILGSHSYYGISKTEDHMEAFKIIDKCNNGNSSASENISLRLLSPLHSYQCSADRMKDFDTIILPKLNYDDILTNNNYSWLKLKFFLQTETYSVVQIDSLTTNDYGLLWYQSNCPNLIYCFNILPNVLRVYNIDFSARYIFCPIKLSTGFVEIENCISYDIKNFVVENNYTRIHNILLYVLTGIVCLVSGALCVYALIRVHPSLLKGSKRILFVKHKTIDALVLPPKIPLRNDLVNETCKADDKKIFIVSADNKLSPMKLNTQKSTRSDKSSDPSYISALTPTDDQLAEWRIRHHFNNDLTITSMSSNISVLSCVYDRTSPCYSLDTDSDKIYETLD